jgi:hypothetical protein
MINNKRNTTIAPCVLMISRYTTIINTIIVETIRRIMVLGLTIKDIIM